MAPHDPDSPGSPEPPPQAAEHPADPPQGDPSPEQVPAVAAPPPESDPAAGVDPRMPYRRIDTNDPEQEKGGCAAIVLVVVLFVAGFSVIFALIGVLGMSIGFGKVFKFVGGSERAPRVEWPQPAPPPEADDASPEPASVEPAPSEPIEPIEPAHD